MKFACMPDGGSKQASVIIKGPAVTTIICLLAVLLALAVTCVVIEAMRLAKE